MLRKCNSITQLAYIRLPFHDLFNAVRKYYKIQEGFAK